MKKTPAFFIPWLFLSLAWPASAQAKTVYCVNCSDKFTQALDRVTNLDQLKQMALDYRESVSQTLQQVRMVQQNVEQYANMVQNTLSLPSEIYGQVRGTFTRLAGLTSRLRTTRGDISALSGIFRSVYWEAEGMGELAVSSVDRVQKTVDQWGQGVDRASEALFQLSGAQLDAVVQDTPALERHIDQLLSTPEGQMQALQAGNTLASMQLQESRQLRELIATLSQAQLSAQMKDEKQDQLSKEQWRQATSTEIMEESIKYEFHDPF